MNGVTKAVCFIKNRSDIKLSLPGAMIDALSSQRSQELETCVKSGVQYFVAISNSEKINKLRATVNSGEKSAGILENLAIFHGNYVSPSHKPLARVESLKNYQLMLRGHHEIDETLHLIKTLGGSMLVEEGLRGRIPDWPKYIELAETKRKVAVVSLPDLDTVLDSYVADVGGIPGVFIKEKIKKVNGHGRVYPLSDARSIKRFKALTPRVERNCYTMVDLKDDEELIISQPIEFQSYNGVIIEFRAWVVNTKIAAIGQKVPDFDIPESIQSFTRRFIHKYTSVLPSSYVLDIGLTPNKLFGHEPVVVEMNEIYSSGQTTKQGFASILREFVN